MTSRRILLASLAMVCAASAAHAEPIAIGIAPSAYMLSDDTWGFAPELVGHTYVPLGNMLHLRPGARLGTAGLLQSAMSSQLRLEEHDVSLHGELGLVRGGRLAPSLTLLAGITRRSISVTAGGIDTSMSRTDGSEWLPSLGAQLGLGLALHDRVMIEPFARYEVVLGDSRSQLRWGFEATVSFGR